jgi:hypothetical protein
MSHESIGLIHSTLHAKCRTPNAIRRYTPRLSSAFDLLFSPLVRLFPRLSGIASLSSVHVLLTFMPNQYLGEIPHDEPTYGYQRTRRRSNRIRSIAAAAGMLAVSSLGAVLVFDWYFFSLVDGLSTSLRPIAGLFHRSHEDTGKKAAPPKIRYQADSLFVPVRSAENVKSN